MVWVFVCKKNDGFVKVKSTKVGAQILFVSPQVANPQTLELVPQSQIWCVPVRKLQIRKFVMINPQISLVSQSVKRKSANLLGQK